MFTPFQNSACVMFANVSLAKASHTAKNRVIVGGHGYGTVSLLQVFNTTIYHRK